VNRAGPWSSEAMPSYSLIMLQFSQRQSVVLDELTGWWEDIFQRKIGSQAVFLAVPPGWGRTTLLEGFAAVIGDPEAYLTIAVSIAGGSLPDGAALQTQVLRGCFAEAVVRHRAVELLGVDRLGGVVQLGLGVGGLVVTSPFGALVGMLAASVAVGAAGRVWDDSPAGQEGAVARLARAVAHVSLSIPVVVMIDDADQLDAALAITLIGQLIERYDGQVLVVSAVDPSSTLISSLISRSRYGLTEGRVHVADAATGMGQGARAALAAEMRHDLPRSASRRIGQRTRTFADVFQVITADRLADVSSDSDDATIRTVVDEVIDNRIRWPEPSQRAVAVAWAGGVLHVAQADRVVGVMGTEQPGVDDDVVRLEFLVRLAGPPSPKLAGQVQILATEERHRMAAAVLETAIRLTATPETSLIEVMVASQAAHRIRGDLEDRTGLATVQCELIEGLEALGDITAAGDVARAALAEYVEDHGGKWSGAEYAKLVAAVLRLTRAQAVSPDDPVVESAVAFALAGGAAMSLEARIWAAVDLLDQPDRRDAAFSLTDQVTAQLETELTADALGDQWRLLLAFHAGKAGYPHFQRILAPLLATDSSERSDAALAVLHTVDDPNGDTRLQVAVLEAELADLPADAEEDRLRIYAALANAYDRLGDYRQALSHGQHELTLRSRIQGSDHPRTLAARGNFAFWTGQCGDTAEALRLCRELLPDMERVRGRENFDTLTMRDNIATLTGRCGDAAEALRLLRELLPDEERVLGRLDPGTLTTRSNIAFWTARCGDAAEALRLSRRLLPDMERVHGRLHPSTLTTRDNIAAWTARCGNTVEALRLSRKLLPDMERVHGRLHPSTLGPRNNIATFTGERGDVAEALRLFRELLPDVERALGPDHPDTLTTRNNVAFWTAECGDTAEALRLFRKLLIDKERVLGPDHPDTLTTRHNITYLMRQSHS
jgi:tetratricopeptide (TPR) repeat protein